MMWTRTEVAEVLAARGIRLRRGLGQNFLVDPAFLEALARDSGAGKDEGVVEIGSGPGNLTDFLAARAGHVWAFEVDSAVNALSHELLARRANVTLLEADGADFERHVDAGRYPRWRVVSNLPYRDWHRLLLALLSTRLAVETFTFMLQEDVYERLRAGPGSRDYGPMPALLQGTCTIRKLRRAGRNLFLPVPRVDSVVFQLRREASGLDLASLERRLRALFAGRRKKSAVAGGRRIESVPPRELVRLAAESP
jgi:16S rRNA (adenine1518-N6/adenine1519-N6)-dimethyltransferase